MLPVRERLRPMPKTKPRRFTLEQLKLANDDMAGFCRACGNEQYGCEPDARKYVCESCGAKEVYGAQELLLMGLVE